MNKIKFHVTKLNANGMKERQTRYKYLIKSPGGTSHTAFESDENFNLWLNTFKLKRLEGSNFSFNDGESFTVEGPKQTSFCSPGKLYNSVSNFRDIIYLNDSLFNIDEIENPKNYMVIDSTLCNAKIQECKRFYVYSKELDDVCHIVTVMPYQSEAKVLNEDIFMYARSSNGVKIDNNSQLKYNKNNTLLETKEPFKRVITIPERFFNSFEEVQDIKYFTDIKSLGFGYEIYKSNNHMKDSAIDVNGKSVEAKEFNFYIGRDDKITHSIIVVPEEKIS